MFPASICTIRVLIAQVRLVLLVRLASEVWKSILSRERKSFQARTCWGPVSCVATLATRSRNLATAGLTCTGTYLIVVVSSFDFVECPEFGFQGHVLGHTILDLGLWGRIACFDLLLIVNVTHQAVPLDLRNVLPARDSGKLIWSGATASKVHTLARLAPFLARASLAAIRSPHVKHEALFGYLGMVMLKAVRSLGTGTRGSSGGVMWMFGGGRSGCCCTVMSECEMCWSLGEIRMLLLSSRN